MIKTHSSIKILCWLALVVSTSSYAQIGNFFKISGDMVSEGDVESYQISADGQHVIYLADQDVDGVEELYHAHIAGGTTTKLNGNLPANGDVHDFAISPDSQRVIYIAGQDLFFDHELYSVPITGGTTTKLNPDMVGKGDALLFKISADSKHVIYLADQEVDEINELYSVPINGGTVVKLSDTMVSGNTPNLGYQYTTFQISSDSQRVIYLADQNDDFTSDLHRTAELYSVPINGGTVVKLNHTRVSDLTVFDYFQISPDSQRVLYYANNDKIYGVKEIYSVPINGGTVVKLNVTLTGDLYLRQVEISVDSQYVIFRTNQHRRTGEGLYGVPITGGSVVKLNANLYSEGNVYHFAISPDSQRVIYYSDQVVDGLNELYSVPITGGPTVKLKDTITTEELLGSDFKISSNSQYVVYTVYEDKYVRTVEHFSVPIIGGASTKLSTGTYTRGVSGASYEISPDSQRVIFNVHTEYTVPDLDVYIYSVPIAGGTITQLNDDLSYGAAVEDNLLSQNGEFIVYRADQDEYGSVELFAHRLKETEDEVEDELCIPIKASNGAITVVCF